MILGFLILTCSLVLGDTFNPCCRYLPFIVVLWRHIFCYIFPHCLRVPVGVAWLVFPSLALTVESLVPADCGSSGQGTSLPLPRRNGKSFPQDPTSASGDPRRHLTQLLHQPAFRLHPLPPTQEGVRGPHEHPGRN